MDLMQAVLVLLYEDEEAAESVSSSFRCGTCGRSGVSGEGSPLTPAGRLTVSAERS